MKYRDSRSGCASRVNILPVLIILSLSLSHSYAVAQVNEVKLRGEVIDISLDGHEFILQITEPLEAVGAEFSTTQSGGMDILFVMDRNGKQTHISTNDSCKIVSGLAGGSDIKLGDTVEAFGYYLGNNNDYYASSPHFGIPELVHYLNLYQGHHYILGPLNPYIGGSDHPFPSPHSIAGEGPVSSNLPPSIIALSPNILSPQEIGASIIWTAQATDPENDPIYYQFRLRGPRTGDEWQVVQDWDRRNTWTWWAGDSDVGTSDVQVRIRDGHHADTSDMDDIKDHYDYEIRSRQLARLNVEVTNAVYSDRDRRVYYCQEGQLFYVKNRVYLTGPDLDKVKKVTYYLHETFPNPVRISTDPSNDFELWIWTWGRFPIKTEIETHSGQVFEQTYEFSFKSKYDEAKRKGIPMVREC